MQSAIDKGKSPAWVRGSVKQVNAGGQPGNEGGLGGESPPVPPTRAELRSAPFTRNYALVCLRFDSWWGGAY
jgi:hypothetical protein